MMKRETLIADLEYCENAMSRLGDRSDIWQDRMVYMAFKILRDILMELRKDGRIEPNPQRYVPTHGFTMDDLMDAEKVSAASWREIAALYGQLKSKETE